MADNDGSVSSPPMIGIVLEVGEMQGHRGQGQGVQVGVKLVILHSLSLDRRSPGQGQLLTEEGVQLRLGEPHHQELEAGVEEAGVPSLVTGHLGLPLTQSSLWVKQVSRRTTETDIICYFQ